MRHEPYQAFEGEVFTLMKKKKYVVHQKLKGFMHPIAPGFDMPEDAETWARSNARALQAHSPRAKLFYRHDLDDC